MPSKPSIQSNKQQEKEKSISAGFIVYRNTKDGPKFLVMYHRGTYWNFPKGGIEKGERSIDTAYRELEEETGLTKKDLRFRRGFKAHEYFDMKVGKNKISRVVILYLAQTNKKGIDITNGNREEGFAWFLYKDARRMFEGHKESQKALKKAYDFITKKKPSRQRSSKKSSRRSRSRQRS